MKREYDFSKAKRAKDVPHLAALQAQERRKTRITIMLDTDVLAEMRRRAAAEGIPYQTLINRTLKQSAPSGSIDEATLRLVLREELKRIKPGGDSGRRKSTVEDER